METRSGLHKEYYEKHLKVGQKVYGVDRDLNIRTFVIKKDRAPVYLALQDEGVRIPDKYAWEYAVIMVYLNGEIEEKTSNSRCFLNQADMKRYLKLNNHVWNRKPILDACCGGKMFYFAKDDPRVLFQDIREVETTLCDGRSFSVKPDVVADFTSMPYPDESFSMVVFDPPHLVYSRGKKSKTVDIYGTLSDKTAPTGYQHIKYGALYSDWRDLLRKGFSECFRVLKSGGFLIFKWCDIDIKVSEILALTEHQPVFGHKSGKRSQTHWICFMK